MKEFSIFIVAEETGFKVVKIKATGCEFSGSLLVLVDGNKRIAEFLTTTIIGFAHSDHVA
jgi:hypothetical protein